MSDATLQLTPSESIVIRSRSSDALVVEGTWNPGGSATPCG